MYFHVELNKLNWQMVKGVLLSLLKAPSHFVLHPSNFVEKGKEEKRFVCRNSYNMVWSLNYCDLLVGL